jgi:hypothetical protein
MSGCATCGDEYEITPALCKNPESTRLIEVDFYLKCANLWRPNEPVDSGEYMLPRIGNGFAYQASGAGRTGWVEPLWPKTLGLTVVSGSITFTCVAPGTNGISSIASPSVASDDTALTVSGVTVPVTEPWKIQLSVTGGTLDTDPVLLYSFTLNGVARAARQQVHVRAI